MGWHIYRNNLGVFINPKGVPVRFGIANDSAQLNRRIKSSDFIGGRPVLITQQMVGTVIEQFTCVEGKRPGWRFNQNDEHEVAQMRWHEIRMLNGGHSIFATCAADLHKPWGAL